MPRVERWRVGRALALCYLIALALSHLWQLRAGPAPAPSLPAREILDPHEGALRIALREADAGPSERPTVLLLHGSPGDSRNFQALLGAADPALRWLAVDLPGFGESAARLSDYSMRAHARQIALLLDELELAEVHVVGFSLGGGVALELAAAQPQRVRSLVLLSSIGVQELELLGDYRMNHLLHGLQLAALVALREGLPHFGRLDAAGHAYAYARNFYDSDQRPLRPILQSLAQPVLIVHGERDPLVPLAAAREHHRLLPQSELLLRPGGHFLLWQEAPALARAIAQFVQRVEAGTAPTRGAAEPERQRRAEQPFAALRQQPDTGLTRLILLALIMLGTLLSEDLSCLSAGILVAQGRLDVASAFGACAGGIFFGDLGLYLIGRRFGERVLRLSILRPLLSAARLHRAERWFARRGPWVILLTRFVPGARLPTYVAAGVLRTGFWRFTLYFLAAVLLWTPLILWLAVQLGEAALERLAHLRYAGTLLLLALGLLLWLCLRLLLPAFSHSGRRRLHGSWQRLRRWEFWPAWSVYLLLAPHLLWLALRHGGLRGVTAVNPGIPTGGLLGESKAAILARLNAQSGLVLPWLALPAGESPQQRRERVAAWRAQAAIELPLVLKPDVGERGGGVQILRAQSELEAALAERREALILQRYAAGLEFGAFYARHPDATRGRLISLAAKELPRLIGDGRRTLRELILDDERAVILADLYLEANRERLHVVPASGEGVQLVELGTHCRGAIFRDARQHATPELLDALERALLGFDGFCFGRFDLRVPSLADLRAGRSLAILELNGLSSEAAHIYDRSISLAEGLATLRAQWGLAFQYAAAQRRRGARPARWRELLPLFGRHLLRA